MAPKLFVPGLKDALRSAGVQVTDKPQFKEIISRQWICDRCRLFCRELVPVLKPGMRLARFPIIHRVRCVNGCHEKPGWGYHPLTNMTRLREWPNRK